MGWEQQGRQYHAWFGSGTSDPTEAAARPPSQAEEVAQMVQGIAAALPPRRQADFENYLASGGGAALARAIPVWASAASLEPARFRALLAGPGLSEAAAASLQEAGRAFADIPGQAGMTAAAGHLAHAIGSDRSPDWRFNFAGAVGDAVYAGANDLLPPEPKPTAPAPVKTLVVASATAATVPIMVRTLGPELAKAVARLGAPGVAAAVIIAGVVYVLDQYLDAPSSTIVEASVPVPPPVEGETPADVLKPGGKNVGAPGDNSKVRVLPGGEDGARELFDRLTKGGTDVTPPTYPGKFVQMPDGSRFGYREKSTSGPPTIDVEAEGVGREKLKFPEGGKP